VSGGQIVVDTSKVITGPPRGTNTTGQELDGPHCVGGGGEA
jgi:cytochrome b6-f complex iron-sulfur subunit